MSLIEFFSENNMEVKSSAFIAKERLKIIVAHQRNGKISLLDSLPQMREEIIYVIRKYANIGEDHVSIRIDQNSDDMSILDIDIYLPDFGCIQN